ncbi:MAG: carbohydrate ABC transporter permease [Spirochaetales bacterium]|jgi:putative aldouronate transport system permease protein|nr:carbohydrate ABC transporter permease [Spirochaetota bacterium]NLL25122.1 carbohydrate ABC transporter permease [Spirochaetales bacterium]HRV23751.1 carbohydrate ABC transporter permease [Sphaerochaeta sp.]
MKKKRSEDSVVVKQTGADRVFSAVVTAFMVFMLIVLALPIWSTITLSVRPATFIGTYVKGMVLPPWKWSFAAYEALLGNNGFLIAFMNSVKIVVQGVAVALLLNIPLAYGLSIRDLRGRKWMTILVIIPYVFNVGLVPTYILVAKLKLINRLSSIYLPVAIGTYNLLIMRSFFEGIPNELKESAHIDGCNDVQILVKIILPLSKAIIMTIGLYYGVSFWNDYFRPMLYLNKDILRPLPILLRNILMAAGMNEFVEASAFGEAPIEAIKAASVFMSAIPMIIVYPFIQKYFTKGTLLGSVKG